MKIDLRASRGLRRGAAGLAVSALVASLAGCGLSEESSIGNAVSGECGGLKPAGDVDPEALADVDVIVGSKDFDEQFVLGQLTSDYLCLFGANSTTDLNTQGSTQAREKIMSGENNIMWEYTGTGWINYLAHDKPIFDPVKQYEAVKEEDAAKNDMYWGPLSPFNNTYAFAVTADFAEENGLETHSDMAAYIKENPDAVVCTEAEFANRPDGYPGFVKAYGITGGQEKSLGTGVIYTQTGNGTCDFGEIFTTDGRIAANDLVVLEDDKQFFPLYNGVPVTTVEYNDENPGVMEALKPLADSLTTEVMQDLNTKISAEGESETTISHDYLIEAGFATEG